MSEIIVAMLSYVLGTWFEGATVGLTKTIATYNRSAYDFSMTVSKTVVLPVAATVVAVVCVLEFVRIGAKFESDGATGVTMIASALAKAVLILFFVKYADKVVALISYISDTLIAKAAGAQIGHGGAAGMSAELKDAVENASYAAQAGTFAVALIPFLISTLAAVFIKVIIFMRFAEIYILSSCAPLPLAFIGHPETKQIAVGYLKQLAAAFLHGLTIILCVMIYSYFMHGAYTAHLEEGSSIFTSLIKEFPTLIVGQLFFIFILFKSSSFAKAIIGQ